MIPTRISDETGDIQATFFDNLAEELSGMTKEEVISTIEDGYGIEDKLQDLVGLTIEFIANVNSDEYNETNRLNPKKFLKKYY
jgi:replication factor A1